MSSPGGWPPGHPQAMPLPCGPGEVEGWVGHEKGGGAEDYEVVAPGEGEREKHQPPKGRV